MAAPTADAIDEIKTLANLLQRDDSDEMRTKIRAALRAAIETVTCLLVSAGQKTRHAAVRVQFRSGTHRDYIVTTRSTVGGACPQAATWAALSFASAGLPDELDLRKPADAAKIEKLLARLKLNAVA